MAFTLTNNLKLRLDTNLTANAKYNLQRIDSLAGVLSIDQEDDTNIRSVGNLHFRPEDASVGGSGVGGQATFGEESQPLELLTIYSDETILGDSFSVLDSASGGSKRLILKYKSDINGSVDTSANRSLFFDLDGADRQVVFGGNYTQTGGSLSLSLSGATSLTLPLTGTLSTLAGSEVLTNKTIDVDGPNTISNIRNANIASGAGIVYSKLSLTGSVVNADINSSAAIAYSKLNLASSVQTSDLNPAFNLPYSNLSLTGSIVNADVSPSASISYSKLNLTGGVTNADISGSAGIDGFKIVPDFGSQDIIGSSVSVDVLTLQGPLYPTTLNAAPSGQTNNIDFFLPPDKGQPGQTLTSDGTGSLVWQDVAGTGTVTSVSLSMPSEFSVSGSPITTSGTLIVTTANQTANRIYAGPAVGSPAAPAFRALVFADLPSLDTDQINEGSNKYFTDERAQDAVGGIVSNSANVTLTYSDSTPSLTANLTTTGVSASTYGSSSEVGVFTVDTYGRVSSASNTSISITSSGVSDFNEAAQDAVGGILTDSSSVDFTYNDGGAVISAAVLPAGVDHNQLLNFVANKHVDHSGVSISTAANSGLTGGGDITTTRSLSVNPDNASAVTVASGDEILLADISNSNALGKTTAGAIAALYGSANTFKTTWALADGTTKAITHSLGSLDIMVQIYNLADGETIYVDSAVRTDTNTLTLTASAAPNASGWRVLIQKV